MQNEPNVEAFCRELCEHGLKLLDGVDPRLRDIIDLQLRLSDLCYSECITADLESGWYDGPEQAVRAGLESYLHVVRERLEGLLGPDAMFPWCKAGLTDEERGELYYAVDVIQLREVPEITSQLAAAAAEPDPPVSA